MNLMNVHCVKHYDLEIQAKLKNIFKKHSLTFPDSLFLNIV